MIEEIELLKEQFLDILNKEYTIYDSENKEINIESFRKKILLIYVWVLIPEKYRPKELFIWSNYEESIINKYDDDVRIHSIREKIYRKEHISYFFEKLLSYKIVLKNNKIAFEDSKVNRDNYGAYYTPIELVEPMEDKILNDSELKFPDVIDFSCGTGVFLTVYCKKYLKKYGNTKENREYLSNSVYGVDVDLNALLITFYELFKILEIAPKKLIFGNPLILSNENDVEKKKKLFYNDLIYDENMGLNSSFFNKRFDIILGNPPWEKIRFEERKYFSNINSEIANTSLKKERAILIDKLEISSPMIYQHYAKNKKTYENFKKLVKNHPILKDSLRGELNTYTMFTELSAKLLSSNGCAGLIVKASLVKTHSNKNLFNRMVSEKIIDEINIFINKNKYFDIDSREEFCILFMDSLDNETFKIRTELEDITEVDSPNYLLLTEEKLDIISSQTGMIPNISDKQQIEFLLDMNKKHPSFEDLFTDIKFGRLVHFTNHSDYIEREKNNQNLPIYEGKFIHLYDGRYAGFQNIPYNQRYKNKAQAKVVGDISGKKPIPESRYFIDKDFWNDLSKKYNSEFMLVWRSLTSTTNQRTMISALLPFMPTSQSIQFLVTDRMNLVLLNALFNSTVFDYLVRMKMPGIDLTQTVIKKIPVPEVLRYTGTLNTLQKEIIDILSELYRHENRLDTVFSTWRSKKSNYKRKELIAAIDKKIAEAYGLNTKETKKIAKQFSRFYSKTELDLYF